MCVCVCGGGGGGMGLGVVCVHACVNSNYMVIMTEIICSLILLIAL